MSGHTQNASHQGILSTCPFPCPASSHPLWTGSGPRPDCILLTSDPTVQQGAWYVGTESSLATVNQNFSPTSWKKPCVALDMGGKWLPRVCEPREQAFEAKDSSSCPRVLAGWAGSGLQRAAGSHHHLLGSSWPSHEPGSPPALQQRKLWPREEVTWLRSLNRLRSAGLGARPPDPWVKAVQSGRLCPG